MLIVVAGIAVRDDAVLMAQRPAGKHLAGLWEFPGGKLDAGETPEQALSREFREELSVDVANPRPYTFVHHRYPDRDLLLLFYLCDVVGEPRPQENNPARWIPADELPGTPVPPADAELVQQLAAWLRTKFDRSAARE